MIKIYNKKLIRNITIIVIIILVLFFIQNKLSTNTDKVSIIQTDNRSLFCNIQSNKQTLTISLYNGLKIIEDLEFNIDKEALLLVNCTDDYIKFDCISNNIRESEIMKFSVFVEVDKEFSFGTNEILCKINQKNRTYKYKLGLK